MPFDLRFAALTTALGVQVGHQDLRRSTPRAPSGGLYEPQ